MLTVILYTTSGCHLCDMAEEIINPVIATNDLTLEKIDIADTDQLIDQYGTRIPVVAVKGLSSDLGWPFDEEGFLNFLNQSLQEIEGA